MNFDIIFLSVYVPAHPDSRRRLISDRPRLSEEFLSLSGTFRGLVPNPSIRKLSRIKNKQHKNYSVP